MSDDHRAKELTQRLPIRLVEAITAAEIWDSGGHSRSCSYHDNVVWCDCGWRTKEARQAEIMVDVLLEIRDSEFVAKTVEEIREKLQRLMEEL